MTDRVPPCQVDITHIQILAKLAPLVRKTRLVVTHTSVLSAGVRRPLVEKWNQPNSFRKVSFLITSPDSPFEVFAVIEVLRAANRIRESDVFDWEFLSVDGRTAKMNPELSLGTKPLPSALPGTQMIFCFSQETQSIGEQSKVSSWLRRRWRTGHVIGASGDDIHILARSGLLDGKDFTNQWEQVLSFLEKYAVFTRPASSIVWTVAWLHAEGEPP